MDAEDFEPYRKFKRGAESLSRFVNQKMGRTQAEEGSPGPRQTDAEIDSAKRRGFGLKKRRALEPVNDPGGFESATVTMKERPGATKRFGSIPLKSYKPPRTVKVEGGE